MTLFTTSIRLIKAVLFGAKAGLTHELNVISWEKEMGLVNRTGSNGCVECNREITWEEFVCEGCAEELSKYTIIEDDDIPVSYQRDCISCDGLYGTPTQSSLMCDHCLSQDDQVDELPEWARESTDVTVPTGKLCLACHSQVHMYNSETICDCDLPF